LESTLFLSQTIPAQGVLTRRAPSEAQWEDIRLGFRIAKEVGRLGIGQSVAIKSGIVLAVEAIEGSDATIRRAGDLSKGGFLVIKVSKPDQDLRFDLPAVGLETVKVMHESGGSVLAVEAGKTVLLEKDELLQEADRSGIVVVALSEEDAKSSLEG